MDTPGVTGLPQPNVADLIQFIVLILLIFLSGIFSSAETSFTCVNRIKIRTLAEEGNKRAQIVEKVLDRYSKMLSAILVGNNIVNLTASSIATSLVIRIWGNTYVGIATGILTFLILLIGEIIPKTWASLRAERFALSYSRFIYALMKILTPIIFLVDVIAKGILRLMRINPEEKDDTITESELKTYVEESHKDGQIEAEEKEMIYNVFEFSDTFAKDIMIPRVKMVTVDFDASYEDIMQTFRESKYTRLPVYREDVDSMVGFINIKDIFLSGKSAEDFKIEPFIREAGFTFEYKKNADLLLEMRQKSMSLTFVVDEYGSTVGMITLEDLLEELVGDIRDEYDADEAEMIRKIYERTYLIEASMSLSDVNDHLGTELDSEEYDSLGGLMIGSLEHLPQTGEAVTLENGIHLKVTKTDHNRIVQIQLTLPEPPAEESDDSDSEA